MNVIAAITNTATNETEVMRLESGDGIPAHAGDMGEYVLVSGRDFGFPNVAVKEKNATIVNLIRMMRRNKKKALGCFVSTRKTLTGVDVDKLYTEGGENWAHFCEDFVLHAIARLVVFKLPIVVATEESNF